MSLEIVPIRLAAAKEFVKRYHRHRKPPVGHICSAACKSEGKIVGVVIVGRPIARYLDDGSTAEVTRLCTDGTRNACSKLYATAWRAARALGYKRLITYILDSEPGTSLRAAGWSCVGMCKGRSWNRTSRPRTQVYPIQNKFRFEKGA